MIILDTHIWIWWVDNSPRLTDQQRSYIHQHQPDGLGISLISCWEVAKAVESGRLGLSLPVQRLARVCDRVPWHSTFRLNNPYYC